MGQVLRVTLEDDGARGLVRLSRRMLHSLGLKPGDLVAVDGDRRTYGRVMPGLVAANTVQIDAALAENAQTASDGSVTLSPVSLPHLQSVVLRLEGADGITHTDLRDALFDMALSEGDKLPLHIPPGRKATLEVMSVGEVPAGVLHEATALSVQGSPEAAQDYDGVGGLKDQIARVHDMIVTPLLRPDLFEKLGIAPPRGVLFSGPPGSGKTLLARSVANKTQASFFHINAPEIVTKHYGDSEAALRKTFAAAERAAPAIVFIDEIDAIAPARSELSGEKQVERRIVAQLLTLMDGLADRGRIVVMAATNLPDAIDPALRRPGRFDREVVFRPPTVDQRREILAVHLKTSPLDKDVDLMSVADRAHGYVGADLAALAREAAVAALARSIAAAGSEMNVNADDLVITQRDLQHGLDVTAPSALRGEAVETRPVSWSEIGGLDDVKDKLRLAVMGPVEQKGLYDRFRVDHPRGILLCGPPGTGKTLTARALAHETGMNFVPVRPPRLLSQYLGGAERAVAELFKTARQTTPTLIFFDEFDAIAPRRSGKDAVLDRIVAQLLMELDGLDGNENLVVLAATNRPNALDPALIRPGRFDLAVEFPLPDSSSRAAILDVHLQDRPLGVGVESNLLAEKTRGLSGADLATLVEQTARAALRRSLSESGANTEQAITLDDFEAVLAEFRQAAHTRQQNYLTGASPQ